MNKTILIGRTTKELALRKTQTGKSVLSLTIAVRKRNDKDKADFINCVAWEKTAELINKYVGKGMLLAVEGRLQSRSYDDSNGKRIYVTEVLVEQFQLLEYKQQEQIVDDEQDDNLILSYDEETSPF